ncbi:hypothetical protein [Streptomyces sp. NPDC002785]|uniref:hypothetical protein n=1 Tax=Streptomyces sp. NPDC002785 TaxID=3154543 RepID=UPI003331D3B2
MTETSNTTDLSARWTARLAELTARHSGLGKLIAEAAVGTPRLHHSARATPKAG